MPLSLTDLSIGIGGRPLVDGVCLTVAPGERVALVGASGSGKSLTAAALTGSLPGGASVTGALEVRGRAVALSARTRPGVAAVRQDSLTALHPLVRIDRQLLPALLRSGASTRAAAPARAETMLEEVGFDDPRSILRRFPMELSGGQRQRVCIVQALACHASYLVADEPTTALDVVSQQFVLSALRRAAEAGTGILLITHDVVAAASLCSGVVVIDAGRTVGQGSFSSLAGDGAHPAARALMRSAHHAVDRAEDPAA